MPELNACRLCGIRFEQTGRGSMHAYCKRCTATTDRRAAEARRMECRHCGRAFSPKARSSRYCSEACRIEGRRRRVRECARRYMADPEKLAVATARRRAASARRRAMAGMKKRQVHDGPSAGRPLPAAAPGTIACRLRGRGFAPYGGARRVYCKPCTDRTDGEVGGARLARCKVCGGEFSTTHRIVKYCSTACGGEARRRKAREYDRRRMADPDRRAAAAARSGADTARRQAARAGGDRPPLSPPRRRIRHDIL